MPKRAEDRTGQVFDRRTVLGRVKEADNKRVLWHVRCTCGYVFTCLTQALKRGGPCVMCGHKGPRPYRRKRPFEVTYNSMVQRARHPVLITYEQFISFTNIKECHYCGDTIPWSEYRQKGRSCGSNLDRKDNDKPYEFENIVVACRRCNYAKNTHFTYDEWLQIGRLIRSWRKPKTAAA